MNTIMFMVSLALMVAGLTSFIVGAFAKRKYSGIGSREFISSQYMVCKIHFAPNVRKRLILRRIDIADLCEIPNMPNWLTILLAKGGEETPKSIDELSAKTEEELLKDTQNFYAILQKLAERSIVGYGRYVDDWKKVDPDYTGKLPKITLDEIFEKELSQLSKYIKKKSSYNALQYHAKYTQAKDHPSSSAKT